MYEIKLNSNNKIPLVGFGTWELSGSVCERCVLEALDVGYRLIDTAKMYGNEREVGVAINKSGIKREDIFLTTKLNSSNNSYDRAKRGIEQSLNELRVNYIDLILIHEPYSNSYDMYRAMIEAQKEGKVRAVGISNFSERLYREFISNCEIIPAINQVEAHIFYQKQKFQNLMQSNGTSLMTWSPLGAGLGDIFSNPTIKNIAQKYSKTPSQIALKFLVQRNIIVIPRTCHKDRMIENINLFDFELTSEEMEALSKLDKNKTLFSWTNYCDSAKLNF